MEWLAKGIWAGSYEEDDIMRLTIAMELSYSQIIEKGDITYESIIR